MEDGGVYDTITQNPQFAVCPSPDCAVTDTGVDPTGKLLPDAGEPLHVTGATPPEVDTVYVTTTGCPSDEEAEILDGQVTTSVGLLLVTVTEKPQLASCPSLECAVTATDVVPTGKVLPEAGVPLHVTGATPPDVVTV